MNSFWPRSALPRCLVLIAALAAGLALVPLCGVAGAAEGDPEVRVAGLSDGTDVHLKSGEVIQDAAYDVDYRFKVLRVALDDGGTRSVSFTEIAAIVSRGVDVTESVLGPGYGGEPLPEAESTPAPGGAPEPDDATATPDSSAAEAGSQEDQTPVPTATVTEPAAPEPWLTAKEQAHLEARSRLWTVALGGGGSFDIPFGDYYEGVLSGVGFGGDLMIAVTHDIGVRLSVSKLGIQWDEDVMQIVSLDPDVTILDQEFGLSAMRFTLSGVALRPLDPLRKDRSTLYAYAGLGFIQHELTADLTVREESSGVTSRMTSDDTMTEFLTTLGGGFIKSVGTTVGIDLSLNVDQLWLENSTYAWVIDLRVGMVVFL